MTLHRISKQTLALLVAVAALAALAPISTAEVNPDFIEGTIVRTVLLTLLVPVPGQDRQLRSAGICSGSFVTTSGLILTAAHCVRAPSDDPNRGTRQGQLLNPAGITAVSVHLQSQARPVLMMLARHVADNPAVDLAILKVFALIGQGGQQQGVPPDFRVPYITVGDSDKLRHGESLAVVGFPGIGGDTVTASQGHVTGFLVDEQNRRLWVKVEASSGRGGSGGPVINGRGEQIAVISHGRTDTETATRGMRAAVVNRIPSEWHEHFRSAGPGPAPGPAPAPIPPRPAPAPVPAPPAQSTHVVVQGRLIDAATGAGIQGGVVVLLRPGVSPRDASREDIVAGANTDGNGLFQTRPPVQRGFKYPLVVLAQGYQQLSAVLEIGSSGSDAITLTIKLARQQ